MLSDKAEKFLERRQSNPKQKDFFNEKALSWDTITIHDPEKVERIADLLDIAPDDSILDVGTGTGVMIPQYLSRISGGHITAVDYSQKMIDVARSKFPESEKLEYRVEDIYDLDDDGKYDIAVCYSCFPHFPDPMKAIDVISKTVRPGGTFVIAHSSSKEHINNVHTNGGERICRDYLPDMDVMKELFSECGLEVTFEEDDAEYYIIKGRRYRS